MEKTTSPTYQNPKKTSKSPHSPELWVVDFPNPSLTHHVAAATGRNLPVFFRRFGGSSLQLVWSKNNPKPSRKKSRFEIFSLTSFWEDFSWSLSECVVEACDAENSLISKCSGRAGGGSFKRKKNYIAKKEFAYRMCARWPTIAMSKLFFWVWTKLLPLHGCDVMRFGVMCLWFDLLSSDVASCEVICGTTPVLLCTTKNYNVLLQYYSNVLLQYYSVLQSTKYYSSTTLYYKVLLQYYSVLQSTSTTLPVLLCTTQYYSSTTLYYKVLLQYYSVLQSTTPVLLQYYKVLRQYYSVLQSTTPVLLQYYKVLLQYYSVLLQYYSVLQSTTPVLLCTTKYYSSTTPVLKSTTPVLLCTTKYYASTTLYYVLLRYYFVLRHLQLRGATYYSVRPTSPNTTPATQNTMSSDLLQSTTYESHYQCVGSKGYSVTTKVLRLPRKMNSSDLWHMKRHYQCAEQVKSPSNSPKYYACHALR